MNSLFAKIVLIAGKFIACIYPYNDNSIFDRLKIKIYTGRISYLFKQFGNQSHITGPTTLKGCQYISIGDKTSIAKNAVLTAWDKYEDDNFAPQIIIGNEVNIGEYCHISAINKITIGSGVLTGRWVTITDNAHGLSDKESLKLSPIKRRLYSKGSVVIEDNVWIGDKVTILPNVHIGKNAIIGANSVINTDVPENSVVAGIPAKVIKIIE